MLIIDYLGFKVAKTIIMKKIVCVLVSLFGAACSLCAQVDAVAIAIDNSVALEIQKSQERAANLQSLCDGYEESGVPEIDDYGKAVKAAAGLAIVNSEKLGSLYKLSVDTAAHNGVRDVQLDRPTLNDWVSLSTSVAAESVSIKEATDKAQQAANAAKAQADEAAGVKNPMKAAKAAKRAKIASACVTFGSSATAILLEESAAQAKAVAGIIESIKSANNL